MSSQPIKRVAIIGASGALGRPVMNELIASGFEVTALTRATSTTTFPSTVHVVRTDYTHSSLVQAFHNQDAVISTIATTSTDQQNTIIDAAVEAGVRRFIPSEYGVDTSHPDLAQLLPRAQPKQDTIAYLRTKQNQGLSWTAIIVGGFFDWIFQFPGLMGWNIPERKATIFDGGDIPYEVTNVPQIARAVVAVLSSPERLAETANQYVYINSFTVTQNQVVKAFEANLPPTEGKFTVDRASRDAMHAEAMKKWNSTGEGTLESITVAIYDRAGLNSYSSAPGKGLWNQRLGLPTEDLHATVKTVLEKKEWEQFGHATKEVTDRVEH